MTTLLYINVDSNHPPSVTNPIHYSGKMRRQFKIPFGQIDGIKLKLPEYEITIKTNTILSI